MTQDRPGFGALMIGAELLTGKRTDKHLPELIRILGVRGLELDWAHTVGDDPDRLSDTLRWTLASSDVVFSFGGIGATPDDLTRQCAARAAGVPLEFNAEGRSTLEAVFGDRLYPHRIHMVEWPRGARPIPNPVNRVPGFSLDHHHFVPGFPKMAWPMVEWVLDNRYAHLHDADPVCEYLFEALDTPESDLIDIMDGILQRYPAVRVSCLPDSGGRRAIEFGLRGKRPLAAAAYREMCDLIAARAIRINEIDPPDDNLYQNNEGR